MFRTVNDQPTLWDAILPPELLVLPVELGRVDALLDDPVFFAPFAVAPPHGRTPRLHRIVIRTTMTELRFATVCWAQVHSRVRQRSNVAARRIVGLEKA